MIRNLFKYFQRFHSFSFYIVVGVVGFLVDGVLLTVLMRCGSSPERARLVSFFFAVTVTWTLNRKYTFSLSNSNIRSIRYVIYVFVQIVGALINLAVFFMLLDKFSVLMEYPILPLAIAAFVALIFNFCAAKNIVFRKVENE